MVMRSGSSLFPTPDRNGLSSVQAFRLPEDGNAMIVGVDRNGITIVAPVLLPLDESPLVGVADRDSVSVGASLYRERVPGPWIDMLVPDTWGTADIVVDSWSAGPFSDSFARANGDPRLLPNYPWYGGFIGFPANPFGIVNQELSTAGYPGSPAGQLAVWTAEEIPFPHTMAATINARNIVTVGGLWGLAHWLLGTDEPDADDHLGYLSMWKDTDPPGGDGKVRVTIFAKFGAHVTFDTKIYDLFADVLGKVLTVECTDVDTTTSFLAQSTTA